MGAGLVLSVITVLVTVAGLVLYMMNCKTNYFVKTTGTDNTIVACLAVAAILEIVMIIVSVKMGAKPVLDIIPVACGVLTAYALIAFVGSRIAAIGSIMTFVEQRSEYGGFKRCGYWNDRMCGRSDFHDYFLLLQSSKGLIL